MQQSGGGSTPEKLLHSKATGDGTSRRQALAALQAASPLDILVIGGGIHGAVTARLAAAAGLKAALVERADFAGATSGRSSKMAHGGLRYLELLDFRQVFEGIKARDDMFEFAGHLVKPSQFLIPVPRGRHLLRLKLGLGLCLYDLLLRRPDLRHSWIPREKLAYPGYGRDRDDLMGCFAYTDGILSDTRLVIENVIAARRLGVPCLNYCEAISRTRSGDGSSVVALRDALSGTPLEVRARLVVSCAGPWHASLARDLGLASRIGAKYSRGSHVVFAKPWKGPSLFLPMEGKARYYFVWPHPAGTLVGTTEREITDLPQDPLPARDELDEIVRRVERDIPDAGLRRENASYCFAGIRTIPLRGKPGESSLLSRRHRWEAGDGVLSLVGGKYTTAWWTALEGVTLAARALGRPVDMRVLCGGANNKAVPGSMSAHELSEVARALSFLPEGDSSRLTSRYGKRILSLGAPKGPSIEEQVAFEVEVALATEQAETLEDIMRRRLELEPLPGHGLHYLPVIREAFQRLRPGADFDGQAAAYRARMEAIDSLLR